jgi:subtilisin family serine protease
MAVVGAADPRQPDGGFPASWPGVIAVAMAGPPNAATLLAPGADIPTTAPGNRWAFVSGASYAGAHVAGLAALVAQLRPAAGGAELRRNIVTLRGAAMPATTVPATAVPTDVAAQAGNIDACASISRLTGACTCSCTPIAAMKFISPGDVPRASQ